MCRILHISKFSVPAINSQCVEFYTLDGAGIGSTNVEGTISSPAGPQRSGRSRRAKIFCL